MATYQMMPTRRRRKANWRHALARSTYEGLQTVALPLLAPICALHPRLRGGLRERLGAVSEAFVDAPVWLHGASAGDIKALMPLVDQMGEAGLPVWISCSTRSGDHVAKTSLQAGAVGRLPFDCRAIVSRALDRLQPRLLVLEGLEMWPSLVLEAMHRDVPVAVVNGRMSARSLRWYRRLGWLFESIFARLQFVSAIDSENADRFVSAGVCPTRIVVVPSSKHAVLPPCPAEREGGQSLVLGSIHKSEAKQILPRVPRLLRRWPRLRVVFVPRRVGIARWLCRGLAALGVQALLGSENDERARVVVHDSFGALAAEYRQATVAFVGGSLIARGGHNLVEPAALAVPVLFGPHVDNCRAEAAALCDSGGGFVVSRGVDVVDMTEALLGDAERRLQAARAARSVAVRLARASERLAPLLLGVACGAAEPGSAAPALRQR